MRRSAAAPGTRSSAIARNSRAVSAAGARVAAGRRRVVDQRLGAGELPAKRDAGKAERGEVGSGAHAVEQVVELVRRDVVGALEHRRDELLDAWRR